MAPGPKNRNRLSSDGVLRRVDFHLFGQTRPVRQKLQQSGFHKTHLLGLDRIDVMRNPKRHRQDRHGMRNSDQPIITIADKDGQNGDTVPQRRNGLQGQETVRRYGKLFSGYMLKKTIKLLEHPVAEQTRTSTD